MGLFNNTLIKDRRITGSSRRLSPGSLIGWCLFCNHWTSKLQRHYHNICLHQLHLMSSWTCYQGQPLLVIYYKKHFNIIGHKNIRKFCTSVQGFQRIWIETKYSGLPGNFKTGRLCFVQTRFLRAFPKTSRVHRNILRQNSIPWRNYCETC